MTFTLSGDIITQTGTDTDLSGLSGIAGVTTIDFDSYIEYNIGSLRIIFSGTQTIAGNAREQLKFRGDTGHDNIDLEVIGTLNIGILQANPSNYRYQEYIPAILESSTERGFSSNNGFGSDDGGQTGRKASLYNNNGTINCYGSIVNVTSFGLRSGSTTNIQNSFWTSHAASYAYGPSLTVKDSVFAAFSFTSTSAYTELSGWTLVRASSLPDGSTGLISFSSSTPENSSYTVRDVLDLNGQNAAGGGLTSGRTAFAEFINLEKGTDQNWGVLAGRKWNSTLKREIVFKTVDENDVIVPNSKVYFKGAIGTENTNDTDANGEYETTFTFATIIADNLVQPYTFFTANADQAEDIINVRAVEYNKNISISNSVSLRGVKQLEQKSFLITDVSITEIDKTLVQGYTDIDTPEKMYDVSKLYLVDNYNGEENTIVSRSGKNINAGSYNVTVLQTGDAFLFDGTTITINSSNFAGTIQTTGTVTDVGGVVQTISDINGDSVVNITTPAGYNDEITVYTTKQDAIDETNSIASGDSIRYQSSIYGGLELWFRAENVQGLPAIGSHVLSVNPGVYTVNVATTSENSALGEILTLAQEIRPLVEESKDWARESASQRLQ